MTPDHFPLDALSIIDRTPGQPPAYAQVAEQLRAVISTHQLGPGIKLPSEPELIERFHLSRMTVREGIRVLRDEGILDARHGTGVFVVSNPHTDHRAADRWMLAQIPIDLPDDHELLAVATIALDAAGEYSLSIRNVVDASIRMTPAQQANALRILATGVEAEAVGRDEAS